MRQYKVIIWGLGNVGRAAVRMIGERQSVKLVAAVDNDPNKVGKDAAGIFGFPDIGVTVTDDIDAALKLDADVVLVYTPLRHDPKTGLPLCRVVCCLVFTLHTCHCTCATSWTTLTS